MSPAASNHDDKMTTTMKAFNLLSRSSLRPFMGGWNSDFAQRAIILGHVRRWRSTDADDTTTSSPQIVMDHLHHDSIPGATVSRLTLNRPKANAMGSTMLAELREAIDELTNDASTRCLILTSSSQKVFSAGADLKERATMSQKEAVAFVSYLRATMDHLAKLPMPVIAAIEGVALGGGLELALAADLRVAGRNAVMGLPETSLAIIPGAGGTQRLPRLVGVARAKDLIFTGRRIDSATALAYGLVEYWIEEGQAESKAIELAWEIAKNGPVAIRAAKEAIDVGMSNKDMTNALLVERRCYNRTIPTEDRLEGLAAFKEGRSPTYKGK